jgi:hypothetical protein
MVMVIIDFPQDESIVPERFRMRNSMLKDKYGVEGFPAFFVLDEDGETVLGQLGAGREKTAESFIKELKVFLRYRDSEVEAYCATLPEEARQPYRALVAKINGNRKAAKMEQKKIATAQAALARLQQERNGLARKAADLRVKHLDADAAKAYRALKADFEKAKKELEAWIATKPERNEENSRKYQAMTGKLQQMGAELNAY